MKILQEGHELYLEQNWVKGTELTHWISNNYGSQYENMIKIFEELLNYQWEIYEQEQTVRIDFNLKNFIVVDSQPILIDFVPPIFIDEYKVEKYKTYSLKIGELLELYYKIDWQMIALVGYWIQEIIYSPLFEQWKEHRKYINKLLSVLFQRCNSMLVRYNFRIQLGRKYIKKNKNVIFHKKIEVIYKFVDEIYGLEETRNIMKHLSRDFQNTV